MTKKAGVVRKQINLGATINVPSGIDVLKIVAVVAFCSIFYGKVNTSLDLTEKRFTDVGVQIMKMQDAQTKLTIDTASVAKDVTTQSATLKEISTTLHNQQDQRERGR